MLVFVVCSLMRAGFIAYVVLLRGGHGGVPIHFNPPLSSRQTSLLFFGRIAETNILLGDSQVVILRRVAVGFGLSKALFIQDSNPPRFSSPRVFGETGRGALSSSWPSKLKAVDRQCARGAAGAVESGEAQPSSDASRPDPRNQRRGRTCAFW